MFLRLGKPSSFHRALGAPPRVPGFSCATVGVDVDCQSGRRVVCISQVFLAPAYCAEEVLHCIHASRARGKCEALRFHAVTRAWRKWNRMFPESMSDWIFRIAEDVQRAGKAGG